MHVLFIWLTFCVLKNLEIALLPYDFKGIPQHTYLKAPAQTLHLMFSAAWLLGLSKLSAEFGLVMRLSCHLAVIKSKKSPNTFYLFLMFRL